jgi:CxxC motif-containing protein (DUF1111 family)
MRSRFPPAVDAIRLTLCGVVVILTLLGVGCSGDAQSADTSLPHTFGAEDAADPSAAADLVRAEPVPVAEAPSWLIERAGDATTTFEVSERSYNLSARNVGLTARIRFAGGDEIFEAVFTPASGLGPDFNGDGCTACHVNNGRQGAPLDGAYLGIGPVVHVSQAGASEFEAPFALPGYGTRLQTYAVDGGPEAQINILWEYEEGEYPDGTSYQLRRPIVSVVGREGMLPAGTELSLRIPPQVAGPGLLEFVPKADIVAAADPGDADGDGISGEVQWILDADGARRIGRHGWKAESVDLIHQSAGALAEDIGISTSLDPDGDGIELNDEDLADLAFYVEALAIPAGRNVDDPTVIAGANLFASIGCTRCHTPEQRTGKTNTPELDDLVIYPFTDLLLHDMGPGLADGRPVYAASGSEWRTAPLWGVGLLDEVNGHQSLLHDGRARSVEEAILWHGGEAQRVTDAFKTLTGEQRAAIIAFVESR